MQISPPFKKKRLRRPHPRVLGGRARKINTNLNFPEVRQNGLFSSQCAPWGARAPHDFVIFARNLGIADLLLQTRESALSRMRIRDERLKNILLNNKYLRIFFKLPLRLLVKKSGGLRRIPWYHFPGGKNPTGFSLAFAF